MVWSGHSSRLLLRPDRHHLGHLVLLQEDWQAFERRRLQVIREVHQNIRPHPELFWRIENFLTAPFWNPGSVVEVWRVEEHPRRSPPKLDGHCQRHPGDLLCIQVGNFNPALFLMGKCRPLLFIFGLSHYNFNNTNWKKHRWCAWDSNLRPRDGRHRRYHGAMSVARLFYLFYACVGKCCQSLDRMFVIT